MSERGNFVPRFLNNNSITNGENKLKNLIIALFVIIGFAFSANSQTVSTDLTKAEVTITTYSTILVVDNTTGKSTVVPLLVKQEVCGDVTKYFIMTEDSSLKNIRCKYPNGTFAGNVSLNSEWNQFPYSKANRFSIDTDLNTPYRDVQMVCK